MKTDEQDKEEGRRMVAALLLGGPDAEAEIAQHAPPARPTAAQPPAAVRLTRGQLQGIVREAVDAALQPLKARVAAAERRVR